MYQHDVVLFLPLVHKPAFQTQGKSQTAYIQSKVATVIEIHLAHFSYSLNFKAIFFSLWLCLRNNLKTYSFAFAFPKVTPSLASVESIHIEEEGDVPGFSSLAFVISFCLGHRGLCRRAEMFFFFF